MTVIAAPTFGGHALPPLPLWRLSIPLLSASQVLRQPLLPSACSPGRQRAVAATEPVVAPARHRPVPCDHRAQRALWSFPQSILAAGILASQALASLPPVSTSRSIFSSARPEEPAQWGLHHLRGALPDIRSQGSALKSTPPKLFHFVVKLLWATPLRIHPHVFPSSRWHLVAGTRSPFGVWYLSFLRPAHPSWARLLLYSGCTPKVCWVEVSARSSSGRVGISAGWEDSNLSWGIKIFRGICPDAPIPCVGVPSFPSVAPDPGVTNTHWWASNLLCSSVPCLLGPRLGLPCQLKPLWLSHLAFNWLLLALCFIVLL